MRSSSCCFFSPVFVASAVHVARACSLPEVAFAAVDAPPAVQVDSPPVGAFAVVDVQPAVPGVPVADCGAALDDWAALQADRCALGAARPDDCSVARSGVRSVQAVAPLDGSSRRAERDWFGGYAAGGRFVSAERRVPDDSGGFDAGGRVGSGRRGWIVSAVAVPADGYRARSVRRWMIRRLRCRRTVRSPRAALADSEVCCRRAVRLGWPAKGGLALVVRVALRSDGSRAADWAVQAGQRLAGCPAALWSALPASPEAPALTSGCVAAAAVGRKLCISRGANGLSRMSCESLLLIRKGHGRRRRRAFSQPPAGS